MEIKVRGRASVLAFSIFPKQPHFPRSFKFMNSFMRSSCVFKSHHKPVFLILLSVVMSVSSVRSCRASLSATFAQKRSEVFLGSVLTGGEGAGRGWGGEGRGGGGGGGNEAMSIYVICTSCCQIFSQ